jgi:NTE family protein
VRYILEEVAQELGHEIPMDVLAGTSAGAIGACGLAAWSDQPKARAGRLASYWGGLRVEQVMRPDRRETAALIHSLLCRGGRATIGLRRGGLIDPRALRRLLAASIPFDRIPEHVRAGRLQALSVSTTHIASGRTIVFVTTKGPRLPSWSHDLTVEPREAKIGLPHALASAAIPLLFPAVRIENEWYCDGGLRQNIPLSPACRLGATRLVVVSAHTLESAERGVEDARVQAFPSPLFLIGKTLNALLLDRIDSDLERLRRINEILAAGEAAFGSRFVSALSRELGPGQEVRPVALALVRASEDIGGIAAAYVRSSEFKGRARGLVARLFARLAEGESDSENDLLSYLLFDGGFAARLIDLGVRDARARHAELVRFFSDVPAATSRVA